MPAPRYLSHRNKAARASMEVPFQMFWGGETDRTVTVQMQATGRRDHEADRCNPHTRTLEESRLCVFMTAILHRPFIWWNATRPRAWTGHIAALGMAQTTPAIADGGMPAKAYLPTTSWSNSKVLGNLCNRTQSSPLSSWPIPNMSDLRHDKPTVAARRIDPPRHIKFVIIANDSALHTERANFPGYSTQYAAAV